MLNFGDIKKLAEILKPEDENDTDSEDDLPKCGFAKLGPGNIGPPRKNPKVDGKGNDGKGDAPNAESDSKSMWAEHEIPEFDDFNDPRLTPEYEISYRQAVGTEDLFLQMNLKTPATASCEDMIVKVLMPGEDRDRVDAHLDPTRLDVRSPLYRLVLPLPQPVETDLSRAAWDSITGTLTLSLRMNRELDLVNF